MRVTCTALGLAGFFVPAGPLGALAAWSREGSMMHKKRKADQVPSAGMYAAEVIVLKFGSSVLRTTHDLANVVHEIYRWVRDGYRVIAVVSAIDNTTERLIQESQKLIASPEPYALAELLATGERASAALLGIALDRAGVRARIVDPRDIGLMALGTVLDSEPVGVGRERVESLLTEFPVLEVPGFFGYDEKKRLH